MPRQKSSRPPKNARSTTRVSHPQESRGLGDVYKRQSIASKKLPNIVKTPVAAIMRKGTILKEVIPFNARLVSEKKLNLEHPAFRCFTSK